MNVLKVRSRNREELVEFTDQVQEKLTESGQREGVICEFDGGRERQVIMKILAAD